MCEAAACPAYTTSITLQDHMQSNAFVKQTLENHANTLICHSPIHEFAGNPTAADKVG